MRRQPESHTPLSRWNPVRMWKDRRSDQTGSRSRSAWDVTTIVLSALVVVLTAVLVLSLIPRGKGPAVGATESGTASSGHAGTMLVLRSKPQKSQSALTTEQVANRIRECVVGIIQYRQGSIGESGEGSGIVMTADGVIITNYHVIENSSRLEVVMASGKKYDATVAGRDARTDLAVIRITAKGLAYATFGNSDQCRVGEQVIAVGNPSGIQLAGSVTQGIISALNRNIDVGNGPMNLIQTDAAINPGNSGGALVNMYGQVIGINSAKIAQQGYEGLGFSIPVNTAKPVIDSILEYGFVQGRVKLGLSCKVIDNVTAQANSVPVGIYVGYVEPSSSAAQNGIKEDDIITAMDGVPVTDTDSLITQRDKHKPGDQVTLTVYRRSTGKQLDVRITLQEDRGTSDSSESGDW